MEDIGKGLGVVFGFLLVVIALLAVVAVFGWCGPRTSATCAAHEEYATTDSLRTVIATRHPECAKALFTTEER